VSNFVSFEASIAQLAHGEKLHTQSLNQSLTQPAYLMAREPKLLLRKDNNNTQDNICHQENVITTVHLTFICQPSDQVNQTGL